MNSIDYFMIAIITAVILYNVINMFLDYFWRKKPLHNFPFTYRGKEFWYSRSVATTCAVFAKNANDKWCVLANRRGEGTPDYQGYWNIVCGYLEHDVSGEENSQKEILEECGVFVPLDKIIFYGVSSSPSENKQNVSLRYVAMLDNKCEEYELSNEKSEENEVSDIKWIPIDEIEQYKWAFNHLDLLKNIIEDKKIQ